jgi:hypothetical protein
MSYFDTFKKTLNESKEPEDNFNLVDVDEDIEESMDSSMTGPYSTPNAFGKLSDDDIELLGYKRVKKVKKEAAVKESKFKQLSTELFLSEASYHSYKKDPTSSPKQKVNRSITEMNKRLRAIEQIVNHNVRLKQESGVDNSQYWKSSRQNLTKISERLLRVSKQLKELAS